MILVVSGLGQLPLDVTRHGGNEGQGHVPPCKLADRLWTECDVEQEANEGGRDLGFHLIFETENTKGV